MIVKGRDIMANLIKASLQHVAKPIIKSDYKFKEKIQQIKEKYDTPKKYNIKFNFGNNLKDKLQNSFSYTFPSNDTEGVAVTKNILSDISELISSTVSSDLPQTIGTVSSSLLTTVGTISQVLSQSIQSSNNSSKYPQSGETQATTNSSAINDATSENMNADNSGQYINNSGETAVASNDHATIESLSSKYSPSSNTSSSSSLETINVASTQENTSASRIIREGTNSRSNSTSVVTTSNQASSMSAINDATISSRYSPSYNATSFSSTSNLEVANESKNKVSPTINNIIREGSSSESSAIISSLGPGRVVSNNTNNVNNSQTSVLKKIFRGA